MQRDSRFLLGFTRWANFGYFSSVIDFLAEARLDRLRIMLDAPFSPGNGKILAVTSKNDSPSNALEYPLHDDALVVHLKMFMN